MILILPSQSLVLHAYAVLAGSTPGNAAFKDHQDFINTAGVGEAGYKAALNNLVDGVPTSTLASTMLANLGLGSFFTQADAEAFLTANASNRAGAMMDLAKALYNINTTDPIALAAVTAYRAKVDGSYVFSNNNNNVNGQALDLAVGDGQTFTLGVGMDNLVGSAFNDNFVARTINNVNTLQDGDHVDGGAGFDSLYVDFTNLGNAITPVLKSIEAVVIRAQTITTDNTNGNNLANNRVQIDAQRSLAVDVADKVIADTGVSRWESNNSRSDVIIEDVRIGNSQKTSDVTIAMVETDPGNVDFGVYFDQHSLRNASTGTSTLTIKIMDTGAAANAATSATPLLNNPYDTFKIGINGNLVSIALDLVAVAAADTYEALLAVFQTALVGTGVTASLSGTFTITDPISAQAVTGKNIVLTGSGAAAITALPGSGWFNTTGASVPATSNIFTSFDSGATNVTELVTSKIILDDVGRGSTGGDLVVGGMSVGDTSISRGVERFEITVLDNSKLQTINSTNNALREVTIVNGATSKTVANAYTATVTNEGDLTVNGVNAAIQAPDAALPGVNNYSRTGALGAQAAVTHSQAGAAGFTDVRLIDASAFKGKLAFTAAITSDVIPKYITAVDTAANPAADVAGSGNVNFNVAGANFIYTGGEDNDTMVVTIDATAASSRSTAVSGQSDFTFSFNGGAGNDAITATIINPALAGGAQAWYTNQKLNANITIDAGAGNDTIKTPGAGDVIINAGDGNDTVYTDNTGALAATAQATGSASAAAIAYTNAAAAELAAAQAAKVASNTTGFVTSDGVAIGTFITPAAAVAALATLDAVTPTNPPALPVITHAALAAATAAAAGTGAISLAQKVALDAAYNSFTGGVVTPAAAIGGPSTIVGGAAVAGNVTAAELAAGDALLATIVAAAKATAATATANDANTVTQNALLNATQLAVVNATDAMNRVADPLNAVAIGTATKVAGLATLHAALVTGATAAQVVAAIDAATTSGVLTGGEPAALAAAAGAGAMDATEAAAVTAILAVTKNTAALANTAAQATLTAAIAADVAAVNTAAAFAAADPVFAGAEAIAADSVGSAETTAAATAAATASTQAAADLAASQAINTALNGLKTAVNVGSLDADVTNALNNANAAIVAAIASSAANGTGAVAGESAGWWCDCCFASTRWCWWRRGWSDRC
jgi:hypothetical protein